MKKSTSSILTAAILCSILGGLVLSIIVVWGVGWRDVISAFNYAPFYAVAGYLITSLLIAIFLTVKWKVALDAYHVRLPFYTLFIYRLIGFSVSYLTPSAHVGGEPVRALLLHKQGIPLKVGFSSAIVDKSLEILFNIAMFFLGALIVANAAGFPIVARISIFVLSILLVTLAAVFVTNIFGKRQAIVPLLRLARLHKRKSWPRIKRNAEEIEELITHFYIRKNRHFRRAVMINALLWILMFLEYKFALLILGYDASLFGVFIFLTGVGIAYSIPIPAALGVLELGQVSAGALLGVPAALGVALAFLIRVRDIVWTVIGLALLAAFHLNAFNLYARSIAEAKKYNYETFSLELKQWRR